MKKPLLVILALLFLTSTAWAEVCPLLGRTPPPGWQVVYGEYARHAYFKAVVIQDDEIICRYRTSKYLPIKISKQQVGVKPRGKNWTRSPEYSECDTSRKMCRF